MAKKSIDYKNWDTKSVDVVDLLLDPDNIRLELSTKNQDEIINDLFVNEDAFQVTKSIVEGGFFPDELPIVVKEKSGHVVIEGNRRVAALKSIINPDLAPSHSARISHLISEARFHPITSIRVVYAPSRQDALHLLAMKHTVTTRRPWRPLRKAYFYFAQYKAGKSIEQLKQDYRDAQVESYVKMWEMHNIAKSMNYESDLVEAKVHSQKDFPISTLERLYNDPNFRDFMGIRFDKNGQVQILSPKKDFEKAFTKVVTDITLGDVNSRELNKSEGIKNYLSSVTKPTVSKKAKVTKSSGFQPKTIKEIKTKSLVPGHLKCNLRSAGVTRMFQELREINYRKFPNATADLLRSLLECSLKAYYGNKGIARPSAKSGTGYVFLRDVLTYFKNDSATSTGLKQVAEQVLSGTSFFKGLIFLDAVNHNPALFATDKEVKEAWDKLETIFVEIFK